MYDRPKRPTTNDTKAWGGYWTALSMPWRTEPEIDAGRQAFLTERRMTVVDEEQDIYPFADMALSRADIEWLLATHESGAMVGPVDWSDESQRGREGLDLRRARLGRIEAARHEADGKTLALDLSYLPLAGLRAGASFDSGKQTRSLSSRILGSALRVPVIAFFGLVTIFLIVVTTETALGALLVAILLGSLVGPLVAGAAVRRGRRNIDRRQRTLLFLGRMALFTGLLGTAGLVATYFLNDVLEYIAFGVVVLLTIQVFGTEYVRSTLGAGDEYRFAQSETSAARLDGCSLKGCYLENAQLGGASLRQADLSYAHLEHANLDLANCQGADLRHAVFDEQTSLRFTRFSYDVPDPLSPFFQDDNARFAGIQWHGCDATGVDWQPVLRLGDERDAKISNIISLRETVNTYYQLAAMLRAQGLFRIADRFAYRSLVIQRQVLLRESGPLPAFGSWLLDRLAGYGYRPGRTISLYLLTITLFSATYFAFGSGCHIGAPFDIITVLRSGQHCVSHPMSWTEAFILSFTAFHGRGFFGGTFQPSDPQAAVSAAEAVVGLLLEVSFIATFTQRFFGTR